MFTANQLVAHAIGDYILQSHWMATRKTSDDYAALIHAITYTIPFVFLTGGLACLFILWSHFFIDRFRLARYVVWLKNGPFIQFKSRCGTITCWHLKPVTATGYPDDVPPHISLWLFVVADNILHVICNAIAIYYFGHI